MQKRELTINGVLYIIEKYEDVILIIQKDDFDISYELKQHYEDLPFHDWEAAAWLEDQILDWVRLQP